MKNLFIFDILCNTAKDCLLMENKIFTHSEYCTKFESFTEKLNKDFTENIDFRITKKLIGNSVFYSFLVCKIDLSNFTESEKIILQKKIEIYFSIFYFESFYFVKNN